MGTNSDILLDQKWLFSLRLLQNSLKYMQFYSRLILEQLKILDEQKRDPSKELTQNDILHLRNIVQANYISELIKNIENLANINNVSFLEIKKYTTG